MKILQWAALAVIAMAMAPTTAAAYLYDEHGRVVDITPEWDTQNMIGVAEKESRDTSETMHCWRTHRGSGYFAVVTSGKRNQCRLVLARGINAIIKRGAKRCTLAGGTSVRCKLKKVSGITTRTSRSDLAQRVEMRSARRIYSCGYYRQSPTMGYWTRFYMLDYKMCDSAAIGMAISGATEGCVPDHESWGHCNAGGQFAIIEKSHSEYADYWNERPVGHTWLIGYYIEPRAAKRLTAPAAQ